MNLWCQRRLDVKVTGIACPLVQNYEMNKPYMPISKGEMRKWFSLETFKKMALRKKELQMNNLKLSSDSYIATLLRHSLAT